MNIAPIAPYIRRALFRPSFCTMNCEFWAVKNQSQLNSAASRAVAPAKRNIIWTILCTIIFAVYSPCGVQPCAFSSISFPSRVMSA